MHLGAYLARIASEYDRAAGLKSTAQELLRKAPQEVGHLAPAGYVIIGSGGKGSATFTPWFGFFDPDETSSPEQGLYVAYLFAANLSQVSVTVMQGITVLSRKVGRRQARVLLARDSDALRARLGSELNELSSSLDLASPGFRQRAYEAGCVCSRTYETARLPGEPKLVADLARFLQLHQLAIAIKRELLQAQPGSIASGSPAEILEDDDPLRDFKPKDEADYVAHLQGRTLVKSRRHERLVRLYGEWLASRGFAPSTAEHPRDLVARSQGTEWLIEAKIVRLGRATDAVREALGQLYSYRHFLYRPDDPVRLVALFSESIGDGFVGFLARHGIDSVWHQEGHWHGSPSAIEQALAE